ncbi:uncharacterized protein LOC133039776 [Cannabis sativa]|uniref:uncharacterized protein LOC133039776 n=1 Tax=Cannabis sativa TaxID=3483 RepID=UPI0029C9E97F|nr:uncharacterized protein LOC133039776 [Cannabis sativa]
MKILSWNARGLGNSSAFRHLRLLVQQQSPQVLFLMETKLPINSVSRFRQSLLFSNGLESPRLGLSGGLMLLWKDDIDISLLNFGPNFFDCYLKMNDSPTFHLTCFYGAPEAHNRSASWTLLQRLADVAPHLPWFVIGDFNEILFNSNKSGGSLRSESQMEAFRKAIDKGCLHETVIEGDPFTWARNRTAANTIKERLDWCFVNNHWEDFFHTPNVQHLDYYQSDHRAICASFDLLSAQHNTSKLRKDEKNIKKTQKKVEQLNNSLSQAGSHLDELKQAENILDELLAQEETYWQQRSRVDWLACGDRNTKFFHAKANARKSNNQIKFLFNDVGAKVSSKDEISMVVRDYYSDIFTAGLIDDTALASILECIPTVISDDHNASLLAPFTNDEVGNALQTMSADKSPGIDGMSAMFYQQHWSIVGDQVSQAVLSILNNGADPSSLNRTLITLIPKIKKPHTMKDFRPISLCNVISKLVTKMIVARFKEVLPLVISETQSAFLSNRLITDNILVAFELVHAIKNKTTGRHGIASLKLDMSKAFDRVEWRFIEEVMRKMGFATGWVALIMKCLTTNQFSFLINGEVFGSLVPTRGLRQGCPLSPYLFLICAEGLSRLLQHEQDMGNLHGYKLTRHAPSISHLLFADDCLLFCQADESSCRAIKRVLDTYRLASGQMINPDKCVMSFSPNTTLAAQVFFHRHLSMPIRECHERYLGLPSYSGRDKKVLFSNIKERIWKLMQSWNEKLFSAGGREVLLKAVVQSIPTYAMSCFRLPVYFCKQLESMMANFWWGMNENGSKIHWRSWNLLCKKKGEGGMGFRSFIHFNQALLAKQAWRLLENPNSLIGQLLKSKYFPHNSFLEASMGHSPSLTWQGITWGRELLIKGLRWKIGEGRSINCGSDPWIPGHTTFLPICYSGPSNGVVANFITEERQLNVPLLQQFFCQLDLEKIVTIPLSYFGTADKLIWHHQLSGIFTVQSAYHLATSLEDADISSCSTSELAWWKLFWSLQIPQKVKIFAWRITHDALPVATSLVCRKIITDSTCSICKQAWETTGHALFSYKYAKAVWRSLNYRFDWHACTSMKHGDYLIHLASVYTKPEMEQLFCTLWAIWTERNKVVHGKSARPAKDLAVFSTVFMQNFSAAQHRTSPTAATSAIVHPVTTLQMTPATIPWSKPPTGAFKLNIDAAVNVSTYTTGVGAVLRDSNGHVKAALSMPITGNFKSHEMEAKALFHSLNWAIQNHLPIMHIETDALMVANALKAPFNSNSEFKDLILDVVSLLSFFPNVNVTHFKRSANDAAHGLAKFALGLDETCTWLEIIPPPIYSVVVNESLFV